MKRYLVHAYEQHYNGLHGMGDWFIMEAESPTEVVETAYETSIEVMNSYSRIMDDLREEAKWTVEDPTNEDMVADCMDTLIKENIGYRYWELNDEAMSLDFLGLTEMAWDDPQDVINNYAVRKG